jgi:hypothetical protein
LTGVGFIAGNDDRYLNDLDVESVVSWFDQLSQNEKSTPVPSFVADMAESLELASAPFGA